LPVGSQETGASSIEFFANLRSQHDPDEPAKIQLTRPEELTRRDSGAPAPSGRPTLAFLVAFGFAPVAGVWALPLSSVIDVVMCSPFAAINRGHDMDHSSARGMQVKSELVARRRWNGDPASSLRLERTVQTAARAWAE
jgi:hypothetical protein